MRARRVKKMPKLNLIPILDAIFIFIFFLLMSAQFIDIYEIGTDAPVTASTETLPDKKKPLNLTLEMTRHHIIVKTGIDSQIYKKMKKTDYLELNKTMIELKKKYPKEKTAILRPSKKTKYNHIIKIIDHIKEVRNPKQQLANTSKLFDKITFNSQD